jgi:glycosyltransferase involved in cell wall biosynthesis
VEVQKRSDSITFLSRNDIQPGKYILSVARLVPEKGLHDLIAAFNDLGDDHGYRLVIAGDADHESPYSQNLREMASRNNKIVMTGYIGGEDLLQVFSHASLFVLPSYHEGLPIALLEAMSFDLSVLVSDIPPHLEVGMPPERYFRCGDVADLKQRLRALLAREMTQDEKEAQRRQTQEKYDWRKIADQTIAVYRKAVER